MHVSSLNSRQPFRVISNTCGQYEQLEHPSLQMIYSITITHCLTLTLTLTLSLSLTLTLSLTIISRFKCYHKIFISFSIASFQRVVLESLSSSSACLIVLGISISYLCVRLRYVVLTLQIHLFLTHRAFLTHQLKAGCSESLLLIAYSVT